MKINESYLLLLMKETLLLILITKNPVFSQKFKNIEKKISFGRN